LWWVLFVFLLVNEQNSTLTKNKTKEKKNKPMEIKQGAFFRNKGYTTSNTGIFVLKQKNALLLCAL